MVGFEGFLFSVAPSLPQSQPRQAAHERLARAVPDTGVPTGEVFCHRLFSDSFRRPVPMSLPMSQPLDGPPRAFHTWVDSGLPRPSDLECNPFTSLEANRPRVGR